MRGRWVEVGAALAVLTLPAMGAGQEDAEVTGPESEELARLRQYEEELFGGGSALVVIPGPEEEIQITGGPSAVTSDAPEPGEEGPVPETRDLSWMRDLDLPDLPIRWDERVVEYLEFFRDEPRGRRHIGAWLRRIERYGPMIRRVLREHGLPEDLLFVAMVESGFDPTARSGRGAAGLWQFVRRTGEEFDLQVTHWQDQRLDPERATEAAARYLARLHDRLGGWELALAAYNMGYGAVLRSIRKYNTNDYWELSHYEAALPFETTLYVAKILACALVARNAARFGFTDLEMEPPRQWENVRVPAGSALGQIARAARTDVATLRLLNPSLRRSRVPPGSGLRVVHLPLGSAETFARRWSRPGRRPEVPRTLRFGESLEELARQQGTTVARLREINEVAEGERIAPGTLLLVPTEPRPRRRREERSEEPPIVAVPAAPDAVPGRRRIFYRCARHDDLRELASFFEVSVDELVQWNGLDPDAELQRGMFLQLFVPEALDLSRAVVLSPDDVQILVVGSEAFFAYHAAQAGRARFRYRVEEGDTLAGLASRFGTSVSSLQRINHIPRRESLEVGEELIVYCDPDRVPAAYRVAASADAADGEAPEPEPETAHEEVGTDEAGPAEAVPTEAPPEPPEAEAAEAPPPAPAEASPETRSREG
jgi:membrane-bound lytic murein transglycosylase D